MKYRNNYNINKLYFKLRLNNNGVYNKICELINNFNIVHNSIIYNLIKTIYSIYLRIIPNDLIPYKFYSKNIYGNPEIFKSSVLIRTYTCKLNKIKLSSSSMLIKVTFLDKYLQKLVMAFNQLKNIVDTDVRININDINRNNLIDILYKITNNMLFYMHITNDVLECFDMYCFQRRKELLFEACRSMIHNFYNAYVQFSSYVYSSSEIFLINDEY